MNGKIIQFQRTKEGTLYVLTDDGELWCGTHFASVNDQVIMHPVVLGFYRLAEKERTYEDIPF